MDPCNQQGQTKGQGEWPDTDGVRLSDTRLGVTVWWEWVSSLLYFIFICLTQLTETNHQRSMDYIQGRPILWWVFWCWWSFQTGQQGNQHLWRPHQRLCTRPVYVRQCTQPLKTCTRCYISTKYDERCVNLFYFLSPLLPCNNSLLSQDQGKAGCTTLTDLQYIMAPFQVVNHSHFILLRTIPPCLASLRAWRSSFGSMDRGPRVIFLPSARVFVVHLATLTAVAGIFFSCSPILSLKSPSFKSWVSLTITYVISIWNTTAN